jgi:hypothetical protein
MIGSWYDALIAFFHTTSQILTAGIAITAFALLLYALTFNLRDRVARSFALILICVVVVFTAEAIGSNTESTSMVSFWLRMQWVGIIFLPSAYLHFSDALLATTGKPSRWRRYLAIRFAYLISTGYVIMLATGVFASASKSVQLLPANLPPTILTQLFVMFYVVVMGMAWFNFVRAYNRTTTTTSRRRMAYLITGALAPAISSFPFFLIGSGFATQHALMFWVLSTISSFVVGTLLVIMAYAVAFFGVSWPDRIVKSRLFKWLLRGPVMASFTLANVTIVRRLGEMFGNAYSALVPISMVATILLWQYLITLFSPLWINWLFFGKDQEDMRVLRRLEDHFVTRNDLSEFLETILSAVCDRLQAPGAYIAALNGNGFDVVVRMGKFEEEGAELSNQLIDIDLEPTALASVFQWGEDFLVPLMDRSDGNEARLLGVLGVCGNIQNLDEEEVQALQLLSERAALALRDRKVQKQVFDHLQQLTPDMDYIERARAASRFNGSTLLRNDVDAPEIATDFSQHVKEALTHYWGGPKLTENPLINLQVVQDALGAHDGNPANAMRSILKEAIEKVKPEGERRFTGEWILYNILEMKFLEGRKVREVALRLAMSEADLYRKQRIAIDAVSKAIQEMEAEARNHAAS